MQRVRFASCSLHGGHKITTSLQYGYVKQKGWRSVLALQMQDEFPESWSSAIKLAAYGTQRLPMNLTMH